jgi:hypothetical protein
MSEQELVWLIWNVRGLNDDDRKTTVSFTIASSSCHIACLQESKLQVIDAATAALIGGFRMKGFAHKPAVGTKGGILVLWDESVVDATDISMGDFLHFDDDHPYPRRIVFPPYIRLRAN